MKDACHKTKKKFGRKEKLREYFKKKTELLSQRLQFKINSIRRIFDQIPSKMWLNQNYGLIKFYQSLSLDLGVYFL